MKSPTRAMQDRAVKAACRYRDSIGTTSPEIEEQLRQKADTTFKALVRSMECKGNEDIFVHEVLCEMVSKIPKRKLKPGKDY
jgi:hypothetical protein